MCLESSKLAVVNHGQCSKDSNNVKTKVGPSSTQWVGCVKKAKFCLAKFPRIRDHVYGCWITFGLVTCSWFLGHGDRGVPCNSQQGPTQTYKPRENWSSSTKTQHVKRRQKGWAAKWIGYSPTNTLFKVNLFCTSLRTTKPKSKWQLKDEVQRWTCPGPHRVTLDWLCDRINMEPKNQIKYGDTKNQPADILTKRSFSKKLTESLPVFVKYEFLDVFVQPFQIFSLKLESAFWLVPCRNDGSPTAKARLVNLVMRSQYKEETSSSSLGSRVNPENDDETKRVGQAPRKWELGNSKSEVAKSRVSGQEKMKAATKQGQKNQTEIKSEENTPGSRKLAASHQISETWNTQAIDTRTRYFKIWRRRMLAINATFSMDAYEANVLTWRLFWTSSMKADIDLGPDVLTNSEIYKNTKFENIWNVFNITVPPEIPSDLIPWAQKNGFESCK